MASCAIAPCGTPDCYVCYVLPARFPPVERCAGPGEGAECRLVEGHAGVCDPPRRDTKTERADLKDSKKDHIDPSVPRAAAVSLGQKKRHREGPHR